MLRIRWFFLFVFYYNFVCKTVKLTKGYFLLTLTVAPKLVGILIQNFFYPYCPPLLYSVDPSVKDYTHYWCSH